MKQTENGREKARTGLKKQLERVLELDRVRASSGPPDARTRLLMLWQSRRLAATYRDFAAQERYAPAVSFFLEDLYAPADFSQRDADLERVYPIMARVLPAEALSALTDALELQALSRELDDAMRRTLERDLGFLDTLTPAMWCEAYRLVGQADDRRRQVALVESAGRTLDEVVMRPVVWGLVRLARGPAHAAGFGALQDFVERGFRAFRRMRGAAGFVAAIAERERALMERVLAGETPQEWREDPGSLTLDALHDAAG